MDHAEAVESEGHGPQNEPVDNPVLRGNSTESTGPMMESMADGDEDEAANMDVVEDLAATGHDEDRGSMELETAGPSEGSSNASVDGEPTSSSAMELEPMDTTPASTRAAGPGQVDQQRPLDEADTARRETDQELSQSRQSEAGPGDEPSTSSEAIRTSEQLSEVEGDESTPKLSSKAIESLGAAESFDHGPDMSVDEEDDGMASDKASSAADVQSESDVAFIPIPQDQSEAGELSNQRAPLEDAYGPFIQPTDTCLADARERLQVALEQTRLLRESFTEQAYERYRCVVKPVPDSLNEILEPILDDPNEAVLELREQADAIKVEKDMEKKQANQAGVGLEELAYFGEGLHLVYLPEDDIEEGEIDRTQFPHRGPTDPETGERSEEISAAAAASTEQVFDRIRRIRAIRMGADITEAGIPQVPGTQLTRNQQTLTESFSPGLVAPVPPSSSPAPSVDSDADGGSQPLVKSPLQHLLTLVPDAEGGRPDGSFTAAQSALIARGVGLQETKHDCRINPLHQRMVQQNYFSPTPSYKLLPPLLGPHQLFRLQAADARQKGLQDRLGARESIKSVVEEICSSVGNISGAKIMGKSMNDSKRKKDGSGAYDSGSSGIGKVLGEERSALEIGLLRRMHTAMLDNQRGMTTPSTSGTTPGMVAEKTDPSGAQPSHSDRDTSDFDPLLAFSVMSAVGLVQKKEGDNKNLEATSHDQNSENAYAQALGLEGLAGLESISQFFHTNSFTGNGIKRQLSDANNEVEKSIIGDSENVNAKDDSVLEIRGGGGQDEMNAIEQNQSGNIKKQKNGVSRTQSKTDAPITDPSLAGYRTFDPMYNAMSQVPPGDQHSQSVIAAAASRQLLQHQLGVHPAPYHPATMAQLTMPMGAHLSSLSASNLSDFYSRNGLPGGLTQHPHLTPTLGMLPSQMNVSLPENHQNTVATSSAGVHYQAALSSINPQHPFGFVGSSLTSQLHSNEKQSISSLPASHARQQKGASSMQVQLKRTSSLSEKSPQTNSYTPKKEHKNGKSDQAVPEKKPASAPHSPPSSELARSTVNGSTSTGMTPDQGFAIPSPPKGLRQEIADLIAHAKFHEAHSLFKKKSDDSEALSIKFLLSLGAAVPIPKKLIADTLVKKLSSSKYHLRLHEFVGSSSSASASRDVIIAIISIWLWAEHEDFLKQAIVKHGDDETDPSHKWLINVAIDNSLSALVTFFDSHPSGKNDGPTKETPYGKVAAIASKSLAKQVFVDHRTDASLPILEDLLKLLDSLRTDALRAKTQERVLVAALASRYGNMSEAFSNAYVSSIVRAGVALGHENICEIGQDEGCRASTMLPYDFFHDSLGVWEEPCRPTTGYFPAVGGIELTKQAHSRSLIQKSLKSLQDGLRLKGGISDGGPYFKLLSTNTSAPSTQNVNVGPPLVRTTSGALKRRGPYDAPGAPGSGPQDVFNPDHVVPPMLWDLNDVGNFPYGQQEHEKESLDEPSSQTKKRKLSHPNDGSQDDLNTSLAEKYRSTQEVEWEDVANMFFHGGSTRNIDIDYDFSSNDHLGKKKIIAPFVREFDNSALKPENEDDAESSSDEDVTDDVILQRHQDVLDEMKLKLDAALETRKQPPQGRGGGGGRKR